MQTKPVRYGRDLAVVLNPEILEALKIDEQTSLSVNVSEEKIVIIPIDDKQERDRTFREALDRVNRDYVDILRRLADS